MKRALLALFAVLLGAQAAHAALFDDEEARRRIEATNQRIVQMQRQLEDRLALLEQQAKSGGLADLGTQIQLLQGDLAKLRGQIEVVTYELEQSQKRQRDLYVDLDSRLRKIEASPAYATPPTPGLGAPDAVTPAAPAPGAPNAGTLPPQGAPAGAGFGPAPPTVAVAPPARNSTDGVAEQRAYDAALDHFKRGDYQGAIGGFSAFVKAYPRSPLSSAHCWIGTRSMRRDYRASMPQRQLLRTFRQQAPTPAQHRVSASSDNTATRLRSRVIAKYRSPTRARARNPRRALTPVVNFAARVTGDGGTRRAVTGCRGSGTTIHTGSGCRSDAPADAGRDGAAVHARFVGSFRCKPRRRAASPRRVLGVDGLGYYRRAHHLRRQRNVVMRERGPPGCGDARAPVSAIDGGSDCRVRAQRGAINSRRQRERGSRGIAAIEAVRRARVQADALRPLPRRAPDREADARLCRHDGCRRDVARGRGRAATSAVATIARAHRQDRRAADTAAAGAAARDHRAAVERDGRIHSNAARPSASGRLWSLPELSRDVDVATYVSVHLRAEAGALQWLPVLQHGFTHFALAIHPVRVPITRWPLDARMPGAEWFDRDAAIAAAIPAPIRTLLRSVATGEFALVG